VVYAADADASFDAMKVPTEERRQAVFRTVRGEGEVFLTSPAGDEQPALRVRDGTVIFLEFHRVRRYRPVGGTWRFWYFEYEAPEELPFPANRPVPVPDPARDEAEAGECLEWLRAASPASSAYASALFTAMVHRWLLFSAHGKEARDPHEPLIREAVAEMRRSLNRPPSIPALAARVGMSERAFRDAFEAVMDWSPKRYFDRLRLEKAAEMLRQNRSSIGEIAEALGYSSPFHLSRAFRELFGVPPSTYASVIRSER
jgi:AraC-like DNA-binding protein